MTETKPRHSGYLSGLIFGAILGALATFLWGTPKGKKVTQAAKKQLTHLKKLQARGRAAAGRYLDKLESPPA